jgi:hypothetical protein
MSRVISFLFVAIVMAGYLANCGSESASEPCSVDSDCPAGERCQDGVCVAQAEECQGDATCNNHGGCDDSGGVISCTCDVEYTGDRCELCADGFQDYGDGNCRPSDPCADDVECAAQFRACDNDQGSAVCGDCLAGYHPDGDSCLVDQSCIDTSCSGHGSCDDIGGVIVCTCDLEYAGDNCESCADGYLVWPENSDTCVDDPCDPDPCDVENGVVGSCEQTDVEAVLCGCQAGYLWNGSACEYIMDCIDSDQDGCGEGSDCTCSDCDDDDTDVYQDAPELCDDKDNDCDFATDEDYPDLDLDCDGPDGDLCENGTWTCKPDGTGLECVNDTSDDLLDVCDGEDNDCDPASVDGSEDPLLSTACDGPDSDLCPEGIYNSCTDGSLVCSDNTASDYDICDGEDNDCDPASADGSEDAAMGTACDGPDSDLCPEGIVDSCVDGSIVCNDTTDDTLDICDGEDNDCDPISADGSEDPLLNTICDGADSDLCPEGIYISCAGGSLVCSDNTDDTLEICDDLIDNDCDDFTDEDCGCLPSEWECGTNCCEGTGCCGVGGVDCQTMHNNNQVGDESDRDPFWFDCVASGTYNLTQALAACAQFTGDILACADFGVVCDSDMSGGAETAVVCGDTAGNQDCACWGYAGLGAGYTYNETAPAQKNECHCPLVGDPIWN